MWCTSAQPASARRLETRWRFHLSRCPDFRVHFCHTSVIELDGRTVGYLQTFTAADELRLRHLALLPEVQGRGFGSTLVRQVQQDAAGRGIPVKLSVFATNPRAEALYARLGFVRTAQTEQLIEMTWHPFW